MKKTASAFFVALTSLLVGAPVANAQDGVINVVVTVDWEGDSLGYSNLRAMENFRNEHPDVPMVHFLNAAYYTKPDANSGEVTRKIKSVLRSRDEIGLHIHGWKSLVEKAGVDFIDYPTFWGGTSRYDSYDYGEDVPVSNYSERDLIRIIRYSVNTLTGAGISRPVSFRAGGWYGSWDLVNALSKEGIYVDHSAVPAEFIEENRGTPLYDFAAYFWDGTNALSQPYSFTVAGRRMTEFPDNGALADYMSSREMVDVFLENVRELQRTSGKSRVVSIGFHQESADQYLSRVSSAIKTMKREAERNGVKIRFVTGMDALRSW